MPTEPETTGRRPAGTVPAGTEPARRGRAPFAATAYTLFVLMAGPNVPTPLYPSYERQFGFSPLVLSLIFAAYALVLIPALLVFGPMSDVVGRRRVLLPALGMAVVGCVLFTVATGPAWLFAARIAQGLALGAAQGTASAALADTEPGANTGRASLVGSFAVVGGIAAGPLIGGVLAQYAPAPQVLPYLVEIALLVVAWVAVLRLLPPDGAVTGRWRPSRPGVPAEMRRTFALAGVSAFVAFAVSGLFLSLMPAYVTQVAGTGNLALAGGIVALMLGCATAVQPPLRRMTTRFAQTTGLGLLVVGLAGIIAAAQTGSLAVVLVATVVTGTGQGLAFGGSLAAVNAVAPADRRGDILSSYYVIVYAGLALPVIGAGVLALAVGQLAGVQIFAGTAVVVCLLGLVAHRWDARAGHRAPEAG